MEEMDMPEHICEQIKRHQALIEGIQNEMVKAITELTLNVRYLSDKQDDQIRLLEKLDDRQDKLEVEIAKYNTVRERSDRFEHDLRLVPETYVDRREFNNTIQSLRKEIASLKWVFIVGFSTVFATMIGLFLARIFG